MRVLMAHDIAAPQRQTPTRWPDAVSGTIGLTSDAKII